MQSSDRLYTAAEMQQAFEEGGWSYGEWVTHDPNKPSTAKWLERYNIRFPTSEALEEWKESLKPKAT